MSPSNHQLTMCPTCGADTLTKIKVRSPELLERGLERLLCHLVHSVIEFGREEYLFPRDTGRLQANPDARLVLVVCCGVNVSIASSQRSIDGVCHLGW
jgi:hypothetical protein